MMNITKKALSALQALLAACVIIASMWAIDAAGVGWLTYALSAIPLLIIIITAVARAYDIKDLSWRGFARKMGMILVASSATSLIVAPLLGYYGSFPLWRNVMLYWGFALAWLTTPNMPPWWKYVSGEYKLKSDQSA